MDDIYKCVIIEEETLMKAKVNEGAFIKAANRMMDFAFKNIIRKMNGKKPLKERNFSRSLSHILECKEDHIRHIDAGIGGASVSVKIGDIVESKDLSIHSLDISKFEYLGAEYRE